MKNPYRYSFDNKRYQTMNYYLKSKYNCKIAKVPLNAHFTCPNRDGTKSIGGCTFCSSKGSGDSVLGFNENVMEQYEIGLSRMKRKWPDCKGFAYFQSYSNTYAPFSVLKDLYDPFFEKEDVFGICIATRADCIDDEFLEYLDKKSVLKETWIELGLQSIHEDTMDLCNRCHNTQIVHDIIQKIKKTHIKCCVHIMNSLPYESKEKMIETAEWVAHSNCDAIKIHMLHLIQGTQMANDYLKNPFPLLSKDEYIDIVVSQLEILPESMIIERLTGDGIASDLIAPDWTIKKTIVLNDIDKEMVKRNTWQGKYYKKNL